MTEAVVDFPTSIAVLLYFLLHFLISKWPCNFTFWPSCLPTLTASASIQQYHPSCWRCQEQSNDASHLSKGLRLGTSPVSYITMYLHFSMHFHSLLRFPPSSPTTKVLSAHTQICIAFIRTKSQVVMKGGGKNEIFYIYHSVRFPPYFHRYDTTWCMKCSRESRCDGQQSTGNATMQVPNLLVPFRKWRVQKSLSIISSLLHICVELSCQRRPLDAQSTINTGTTISWLS